MTKRELQLAQYLHGVAEQGIQHMPTQRELRKEARGTYQYSSLGSLDRQLTLLRQRASDMFMELTGKSPLEVPFWELNTEKPAEWTKTARPRK
jgi:hypothetical protein